MRPCKKYRQQLVLVASNDLTPGEEKELRHHLEQCPSCREEFQEIQQFVGRAQEQEPFSPDQALLEECRAELRERLQLIRLVQRPCPKVLRAWTKWRALPAAVSAIILFAMGMAAGRYLFPSRPVLLSPSRSRDETVKVRLLDWEAQEVELQLGDVFLRGPASDPRLRPFLVQALGEADNPGQRLRLVKALAAQPLLDEDVEAALIFAMERDPNNGVRLQAIRVLKAFPLTKPVKDALIRVLLTDRNPSIRKEAIDALSVRALDPEVTSTLRGLARTDTSTYVRRKAGMALERRDSATPER